MDFPNLLYYNAPSLPPVDITVFEDLQLLRFIPEETALAVSSPCDGENIKERQAFIQGLGKPEVRAALEKLNDDTGELSELDRRLRAARCTHEKDAVFAALAASLMRFMSDAADFPRTCPLACRFADFFGRRRDNAKTSGFEKAVESASKRLFEPSENVFTVHKHTLSLSPGSDETYFSRISKCADELGLEPLDNPTIPPVQLSPEIINTLAAAYPDAFEEFAKLRKTYEKDYDPKIARYREATDFYLVALRFLDRIRAAGIPLCYPSQSFEREIDIKNAYDVSLLAKNETNIIPNDITFTQSEPFFYLTGANGGGKTTYLRTVGIALLMYVLGLPVACEGGRIYPPDGIFTHFPRDERFDGTGRFVEEQNRVEKIRGAMTENSVVLLNETYSSTNEENAVIHTTALAEELFSKGIFGLYITHQHSIVETEIPFLNVVIDRNDSNRRTFKVARQKNTGGSFARDILERYSLTKEALEARFGGETK